MPDNNPYDDSFLFPAASGTIPTERNMSVFNPQAYGLGLIGIGNSVNGQGPVNPPVVSISQSAETLWEEQQQ